MPVTTLMDIDDGGSLAMATVMHLDQVDSLGSLQNAPRFIDDVVVYQLMRTMPLSIRFCPGLCNQLSDTVLLAVRFKMAMPWVSMYTQQTLNLPGSKLYMKQ